MNISGLIFGLTIAWCATVLSSPAMAAVPNSFSAGTPAVAAEINENFVDLDTRVNALEGASNGLDFSGYSVPFSADGAPKNVVVLASDAGSGFTNYSVRSRYENSVEQVSVDGVPTVRPFIANYASTQTDNSGNLTFVSNYLESPDTSDYVNYNAEESTYDVNSLV